MTMAEEVTDFSGSAGLWTTVGDYSLFARMLANNGSFNGRQYLKPETVKQMASNQIGPLVMGGYPLLGMPVEGLTFGFGFLSVAIPDVAGTRLPVGSFGWDGDGTRLFWAVPEERIAIVSMVPFDRSAGGPAAAHDRSYRDEFDHPIIRRRLGDVPSNPDPSVRTVCCGKPSRLRFGAQYTSSMSRSAPASAPASLSRRPSRLPPPSSLGDEKLFAAFQGGLEVQHQTLIGLVSRIGFVDSLVNVSDIFRPIAFVSKLPW